MKRLDIDASQIVSFDGSNEVENIDYILPNEKITSGGELLVKGAQFGDWASAQVVHPVAGVITQYVNKIYLKPGAEGVWYAIIEGQELDTKIPQGLILRVAYHSNGVANRTAVINYNFERVI